jgi:hypothetical protein
MGRKSNDIDNLFQGDGTVKQRVKLSPFFLRPAYQYTCQEIRNWQRESWEADEYVELEGDEINGCNYE